MIDIILQPVPSQSFSIDIEGNSFNIAIKTAGTVIADITINNSIKILGVKCRPNLPIIPYGYLEAGNFFIITEAEELPDYAQFGITQQMVYLTALEMEAYNAN